VTAPKGYAEYTGTGVNAINPVKVVLDYIQKRVYLTLTHYQYWALIDKGGGNYEFWTNRTQDFGDVWPRRKDKQGLDDRLDALGLTRANATVMNPWVEILPP
jgi:hypothetical protein